jgi:phage FluMu protein Com
MALRITDLRCSTPGCNGKKLAEAVDLTIGAIRIKCPRCKQVQTIAVSTTQQRPPSPPRASSDA